MTPTSTTTRGAMPERKQVGWVFAGGGARGAYEVGVCRYIFDRIAGDLGNPIPVDVISGTSIGAIHASALAAWIHDPAAGVRILASKWTGLSLDEVIRVDRRRTFNMFRSLLGRPPRRPSPEEARGGILDARPLEALLASAIDFQRIGDHLRAGRLRAVSVTATHVGSGRTSVFYQQDVPQTPPWERGRTSAYAVTLAPEHALASAAIPFLFPAVRVGGELYCDGSLRQHVPLSPARHLGAQALVVINPRAAPAAADQPEGDERQKAFPGPLFLLGKTLNALTLDRIDGDIEQIELVNRLLSAGQRRFGPDFVRELNHTLADGGAAQVSPISLLHIHASEDIGKLSADFVRSRRFGFPRRNILERAMAQMAKGESPNEADLLSYVLFDGRFASELIELGWRDAERQHGRILEFFRASNSP